MIASCDQQNSHDGVDVAGGANGLVGVSQNPAAGRRVAGVFQTASHYSEKMFEHQLQPNTALVVERMDGEKGWCELTWVWAADEGAQDERRAQSH